MDIQTVAFWHYEGNQHEGKDQERKGDLLLAQTAFAYWKEQGEDDSVVQKITPSRAGCKAEQSSFGRTYAFHINAEALQRWATRHFGD